VKANLSDPDSAQFKSFYKNKSSGVICGEVNSKNRMGGYVGFSKFLILPGDNLLFEPHESASGESTSEILRALANAESFRTTYEGNCLASDRK
jgi:DNA-directed RNA polymerase subunit E'/Rpb7